MPKSNYKELNHTLATVNGKRAWVNAKEIGTKSLDEKTATDLNAQFGNTGIKYELIEEEEKTVDYIVTEEDLANNPEMVEQGIKVGDTIQIPLEEETK